MNVLRLLVKPFAALGLATLLFSCNNNESTSGETAKTEDTTATSSAETTPAPATFTPFTIMRLSHSVKNYATWRPAFDIDSVERKASGLENIVVGQEMDKPNSVSAFFTVADVQKAKDFASNPRLKEVMGKAGVIAKPNIQYLQVQRFSPDEKINQWVVVTHKVKDYDAWIKAYDGEGKEKRAGEGMLEAGLARGVDDPNLVVIVFDITDLTKARTAIFSEEKKKLMVSAGVEGKPAIEFYNTAQ